MKLRFFKTVIDGKTATTKEITYDEALEYLLNIYRDNDMTRDMLTVPNWIITRTGAIEVRDETEEEFNLVLLGGEVNRLPENVFYDDEGNHLAEAVTTNTFILKS